MKDRTDDPEDSGDDDGWFATDAVGELCYSQSAQERASGHCGDDGSLSGSSWVVKRLEVCVVLRGWSRKMVRGRGNVKVISAYIEDSGHGGYVHAKKDSSDAGKGAHHILKNALAQLDNGRSENAHWVGGNCSAVLHCVEHVNG